MACDICSQYISHLCPIHHHRAHYSSSARGYFWYYRSPWFRRKSERINPAQVNCPLTRSIKWGAPVVWSKCGHLTHNHSFFLSFLNLIYLYLYTTWEVVKFGKSQRQDISLRRHQLLAEQRWDVCLPSSWRCPWRYIGKENFSWALLGYACCAMPSVMNVTVRIP